MNRPKAEFPKLIEERSVTADTKETHPAYGQLSFSRMTGDPGVLYGSHLDRHMGHIRMTLQRSDRMHNLSQDWFYGGEELVAVDLSYVQFAELLTTMNHGSGVPCTIRRLPGAKAVPEIAHSQTEQKRVREDFTDRLGKVVEKSRAQMAAVEAVLAKPNIGKADREKIRQEFEAWINLIESSAPFVLDQFQESVERTAGAAKAEVEGFISSAVASVGLKVLRDKFDTGFDGPPAPGDALDKPK